MTYRWGAFSTADPIVFRPIPEDMRVAVTLDGTLVIMYVTSRDVQRVNSTKGIVCEMSTDENATYSHSVELLPHGIGERNRSDTQFSLPGLLSRGGESMGTRYVVHAHYLADIVLFLAGARAPCSGTGINSRGSTRAPCPGTATSLNIAFCWRPSTNWCTVPGHGH